MNILNLYAHTDICKENQFDISLQTGINNGPGDKDHFDSGIWEPALAMDGNLFYSSISVTRHLLCTRMCWTKPNILCSHQRRIWIVWNPKMVDQTFTKMMKRGCLMKEVTSFARISIF
jgi:hypothetical protein